MTSPPGKGDEVVMLGAAMIVMLKALETYPPALSVALKVTEAVPAAVGMPLINPVLVLSDRPSGKPPAVMDQV